MYYQDNLDTREGHQYLGKVWAVATFKNFLQLSLGIQNELYDKLCGVDEKVAKEKK